MEHLRSWVQWFNVKELRWVVGTRRARSCVPHHSAGACVAGPDLQGIDLVDDASAVPPGYSAAIEPRCLDLIPFRIVPHWRSEHPESELVESAAVHLDAEGLSHRCLRDGQALVVDGDTVTLLELNR